MQASVRTEPAKTFRWERVGGDWQRVAALLEARAHHDGRPTRVALCVFYGPRLLAEILEVCAGRRIDQFVLGLVT